MRITLIMSGGNVASDSKERDTETRKRVKTMLIYQMKINLKHGTSYN